MQIALVKIDVAAVDLGKSVARIEQLVDGGTPDECGLLWVFNLAVNRLGRNRSLRFWRAELLARAAGAGAAISRMSIGSVIAEILPARRTSFYGGQVDQIFQIRPRTRLDLAEVMPGQTFDNATIYRREVLEQFLSERWLGNLNGGKS